MNISHWLVRGYRLENLRQCRALSLCAPRLEHIHADRLMGASFRTARAPARSGRSTGTYFPFSSSTSIRLTRQTVGGSPFCFNSLKAWIASSRVSDKTSWCVIATNRYCFITSPLYVLWHSRSLLVYPFSSPWPLLMDDRRWVFRCLNCVPRLPL